MIQASQCWEKPHFHTQLYSYVKVGLYSYVKVRLYSYVKVRLQYAPEPFFKGRYGEADHRRPAVGAVEGDVTFEEVL